MKRPLAKIALFYIAVMLSSGFNNAHSNPEKLDSAVLHDLITIAFEHNPRIQSARSDWRAMVAKYPQAISLPDPVLNISFPIDSGLSSSDLGFELMQMMPNPSKIRLRGRTALNMAEIAHVRFEKTVRDELINLLKIWYEIGYLDTAISIAEDNREMFEQIVEVGRLKYAQGELNASELYAAETRFAQAEYELVVLNDLRSAELSKLRKSLGVNIDIDLAPIILPDVEENTIDLETLKVLAQEHSQELAIANLSVESAEINVSLARAMNKPDFSLGLMYNSMSDGMSSMGDDNYGIMLGITIPIWGGKNRSRINEATAHLESSKAKLNAQILSTDESIDKHYYRILNLFRLVELYDKSLIPQALTAAEMAQSLYESGEIPYSQLLETRVVSQNVEIAFARAQTDYLIALADLAGIVGIPVIDNFRNSTENEKVMD